MGKRIDNNSDSRGDSVSHSHVTFPLKLRKSNKSAFGLSVPECSAALNINMTEREGGGKRVLELSGARFSLNFTAKGITLLFSLKQISPLICLCSLLPSLLSVIKVMF